jgi:hypothetical protein
MINLKKYIPKILIALLFILMMILLYLTVRHIIFPKENGWKYLETSLYRKENIIDGIRDADKTYTIISREGRADYGDLFVVFEQTSDQSWKRSYENDFEDLKPWKIERADIDGDGVKEILTAVRKTTHFDKDERNRLFIFNYEDKKLIKKWTGSLMTGDWEDFTAGDLLPIPGDELVFTMQSRNGKEYLSIYYWLDFGFQGLANSKIYQNIEKLSITGENQIQISYEKGQEAILTLQDGKITEAAPEK